MLNKLWLFAKRPNQNIACAFMNIYLYGYIYAYICVYVYNRVCFAKSCTFIRVYMCI